MAWFWLNIPLALFFFCCWAGIPLWLTLTRWHRETSAKHAEIAAMAIPAQVIPEPARHPRARPAARSMPQLPTWRAAEFQRSRVRRIGLNA